jgi:hypothetical protein
MAEITFLPEAIDNKIQYCLDIVLKEAKLEDRVVKQILYTMLSMYTNDPRNLAINSPTGEGKNYVIRKVSDIFPKEDVIKFVGMSDKSLFHRSGNLVIKNDIGEYESIEETLERIDSDIEDKESEMLTTQNRNLKQGLKAQIRDLEKERKNLHKDAKKLIDLSHKTIIFLDTPRQELLNAIMSLLSHDEYEVEYEFVDTNNGIKTRSNVLRGWPVVIFAQAVDYSHHKRYPEIQRRFTITNPRMDQEKYAAAVDLIFDKYSMPDFMYQKMVVSDEQKDQAREIIKGLKESILDLSGSVAPGKNNVFIPFEKAIRDAAITKKASDMTVADRICGNLTLLAAVNTEKRPIIAFRKRGSPTLQKIPLATFDDLKEALFLMQYANGVRPYILEWYYDVFIPTYDTKTEVDIRATGRYTKDGNEVVLKENRIALTTQQLSDATFTIRNKKLSSRQIRETYLDQLINEGYVDTVSSELDRRADIFFPVITTKIGEKENTYISVESPIFPTQDYIRSQIQALLTNNDDDAILETQNIDEILEYYKEPEKCFKERIIPTKNMLSDDSPDGQEKKPIHDSATGNGEGDSSAPIEDNENINAESSYLVSYPNGAQTDHQSSNEDQKKEKNEKCRHSPNLVSLTEDSEVLKDIPRESWHGRVKEDSYEE